MEVERLTVYNELTKHPLPKNVITYKAHRTTNGVYQKTNFDDLIVCNLQELVPNIHLGEYRNNTKDEMITWINNTKLYGDLVHRQFQELCNEKMNQILHAKQQQQLYEKFKFEKVDNLPLDIQRTIKEYLLPETKLTLLEALHPNLRESMKKWKVHQLKIFYKTVVQDQYYCKRNINYLKPTLIDYCCRGGLTNKDEYITEIFNILNMFKTAMPTDVEKYHYHKSLAAKLFSSIVYVNNKLVVIPNKEKENIKGGKKRIKKG
jgi:hypothetical protein